ncbi:hypothetical protein [Sutcliffiella cohnii]|uniref:hypothetical protein n=1 Tax=Sutcliffiella cohnii TaxID=33932 RepID=UPI000835E1C6|nr:hypothetical protein [Sutcliffiella cohnii]
MGTVVSDIIFRKTYFLKDDETVVEFFSLVEEKRTYFKNNPNQNKLNATTLKTSLREVPIEELDVSFIETLSNIDVVKKYHLTKEKKERLLRLASLFEAKEEDYQ